MASEEICVSWRDGVLFSSLQLWKSLSKAQHTLKQEYLASHPDTEERNLVWVITDNGEMPCWYLKKLGSHGHFEGASTGIFIREMEILSDS